MFHWWQGLLTHQISRITDPAADFAVPVPLNSEEPKPAGAMRGGHGAPTQLTEECVARVDGSWEADELPNPRSENARAGRRSLFLFFSHRPQWSRGFWKGRGMAGTLGQYSSAVSSWNSFKGVFMAGGIEELEDWYWRHALEYSSWSSWRHVWTRIANLAVREKQGGSIPGLVFSKQLEKFRNINVIQ